MSNKERLEEIKEKYIAARVIESFKDIFVVVASRKDLNWLIEQAERAQELEEENFALMESLRFQDEILERQNKRYREALEFYADEKNYRTFDSPAIRDYGEKARKAVGVEVDV